MKKTTNINSVDSLEKEIYRLKLESKNLEEKLDRNLQHLQDNYFSMTMNSFFSGKEKKNNGQDSFWKHFPKNEAFAEAMNTVAGNIATKAAEGLNDWMNKFFDKHKH